MNRQTLTLNGDWFELKVGNMLRSRFPNASILHNLSLYSSYLGEDTQIDLLMVKQNGIYVFEVKKWGIFIKGSRSSHYWSGKATVRNTIQQISPEAQNFMHIRALRNALRMAGYKPPLFSSYVIVPDGTNIETNCEEVNTLSQTLGVLQYRDGLGLAGKSVEYWRRAIESVCI